MSLCSSLSLSLSLVLSLSFSLLLKIQHITSELGFRFTPSLLRERKRGPGSRVLFRSFNELLDFESGYCVDTSGARERVAEGAVFG